MSLQTPLSGEAIFAMVGTRCPYEGVGGAVWGCRMVNCGQHAARSSEALNPSCQQAPPHRLRPSCQQAPPSPPGSITHVGLVFFVVVVLQVFFLQPFFQIKLNKDELTALKYLTICFIRAEETFQPLPRAFPGS